MAFLLRLSFLSFAAEDLDGAMRNGRMVILGMEICQQLVRHLVEQLVYCQFSSSELVNKNKSSINTLDRSSSTNGSIQSSCLVGNSYTGFYSCSIGGLSNDVPLGYV